MKVLQKLINSELEKVLIEVSYTQKDIPTVFWMVTSIDEHSEKFLEQISTGKLKGVKGISGTKEIVTQWLGIARNAVIVIPAKKFLKLNNVSRIMYDNPHYLVSKNMTTLFRLFDRSPERDYDWFGLMQTVMGYVQWAGKQSKPPSKSVATILYYIEYGTLAATLYGSAYKDEKPNINSIKELAAWVQKTTIKIAENKGKWLVEEAKDFPTSVWENLIVMALKRIGEIYKSEGEWMIKGDTMEIPNGSTIFIALDVDPKSISNQARQEYTQVPKQGAWPDPPKLQTEKRALRLIELTNKYNLSSRYQVNFISMEKFEKYREKYHEKLL